MSCSEADARQRRSAHQQIESSLRADLQKTQQRLERLNEELGRTKSEKTRDDQTISKLQNVSEGGGYCCRCDGTGHLD